MSVLSIRWNSLVSISENVFTTDENDIVPVEVKYNEYSNIYEAKRVII